jgi:hypothetical protein
VPDALLLPASLRVQTPTPLPGYRNKSIKTLIANLEAGKSYPDVGDDADTQANMLCKVCTKTHLLKGWACAS